MLLSPLWYYTRARRTRYALTNRRAVIATSGAFPVRTSVPLGQVPFVDVELKANRSGHLLFREVTRRGGNGTWHTKDGFIAVRNVENLERLFRDAIAHLEPSQRGVTR